jgi:hypothetical protein
MRIYLSSKRVAVGQENVREKTGRKLTKSGSKMTKNEPNWGKTEKN